MHDVFEFVLRASIADALTGVADWWTGQRALSARFSHSLEQALAGGFVADRLGYAFASGYSAALGRLWAPASGRRVALCASEQAGNHPRAIRTRLERADGGWLLSGHKTHATLGTHAEQLLVVARAGTREDGRPQLAVVAVPANAPGVELSAGAPLPFIPEIPHATLTLTDVRLPEQARLPGDGYSDYLKPFRSIEDLHVHAAVLGWLIRLARRWSWPAAHLEEALSLAAGLRALADSDPGHAGTHLALAGSLAALERLLERLPWPSCDAQTCTRWQRDRALLRVAGKARQLRRDLAYKAALEP